MKLVWLDRSEFLLHAGEHSVAIAGDTARGRVAGAPMQIGLRGRGDLPPLERLSLGPVRPLRAIDDEVAASDPRVFRVDEGTVVVDLPGERRVVLHDVASGPTVWGRWADGAVIVLAGGVDSVVASGLAALERARPALLAVAATAGEVDDALALLSPELGGAGLQILEPGLGMEA